MNIPCSMTRSLEQWVHCGIKFAKITRTIGVYWRLEHLPKSWLTEQFWQCPRFTSSFIPSSFIKPSRESRIFCGYWFRRRVCASNLHFHVGRQLLDHIPLQETPGSRFWKTSLKKRQKWIWSPSQASLWRTSTYASEEDVILGTSKGLL